MENSYIYLTPAIIGHLESEAIAHGNWHISMTMRFFRQIYDDKLAPRRPAYEEELRAAYKRLYAQSERGKERAQRVLEARAQRAEARRLEKEARAKLRKTR